MNAKNFPDDIPSIPIANVGDHYVLLFDSISMQGATKNCHYPELAGEPMRLELYFIYPWEHVIELIVLGKRVSLVAVDMFGAFGEKRKKVQRISPANNQSSPLLKYRCLGSFPFD